MGIFAMVMSSSNGWGLEFLLVFFLEEANDDDKRRHSSSSSSSSLSLNQLVVNATEANFSSVKPREDSYSSSSRFGPIERGFISGLVERGFHSWPLDRGPIFFSPLEKGLDQFQRDLSRGSYALRCRFKKDSFIGIIYKAIAKTLTCSGHSFIDTSRVKRVASIKESN
ncbi:hypothetical protein NE237_030964 [Protea cynaroides]|uniref:Uncharacterized protein n=1 Tax=Protea cynaroides TaxID=273540 RepID=A0A9Q0GY67_9MAGN|nr:hypothetical protein NE237_030964 [Protea cynaroides]